MTPPHGFKQSTQLVLAWLVLNLSLNYAYPNPATPALDLLRPSLEVWGLLVIVSLSAARNIRSTPWLHVPLILLLVFLHLFRSADGLMPHYLSRPLNLYNDAALLPDFIHLLTHSLAAHRLALYAAAAGVVGALWIWSTHRCLCMASHAFSVQRIRRVFWGLTALLMLWLGLHGYGIDPFRSGIPAATCVPRLLEEVSFLLKVDDIKRQWLATVPMAPFSTPSCQAPLVKLQHSDVYLFILESYGETLYSIPGHGRNFAPRARAFEAALQRAGFTLCSTFLESPTFGGSSWLAHATLESGVWLPDQTRYHFLLHSDLPLLVDHFNRAGYRTVSVMPGITMPWPEGAFFRYARTYYARDLDYQGPPFGWSPMPDQYTVHAVHAREIAERRQPLFIRWVLTSSHAPFHVQPPYVPDWEAIGRGEVYQRIPPVTFPVSWADMRHAGEAYLAAVGYDLTVLQDYLCRFIQDGALILLLGDHQPIAQVTGPGASARVPVHVISRNPALLEPFLRMGYTPGVVPARGPIDKGLQHFLADFLMALSATRVEHYQ